MYYAQCSLNGYVLTSCECSRYTTFLVTSMVMYYAQCSLNGYALTSFEWSHTKFLVASICSMFLNDYVQTSCEWSRCTTFLSPDVQIPQVHSKKQTHITQTISLVFTGQQQRAGMGCSLLTDLTVVSMWADGLLQAAHSLQLALKQFSEGYQLQPGQWFVFTPVQLLEKTLLILNHHTARF